MALKEVLMALKDVPVSPSRANWFVDRKEELSDLSLLLKINQGEIIGVSGERGVGKTTIFNMLPVKKLIINVIDRETKIGILRNVLYGLYEYARENYYSAVEGRARDAIRKIDAILSKEKAGGFSYFLSFSYLEREEHRPTLFSAVKELKSVVNLLAERENLTIILDEIDKNRKEEVLLILDLMKDAFLDNEITLLVALPYSIYLQFIRSAESRGEDENIENSLKHVYLLRGLRNKDLLEMVERRTGENVFSFIDEKALHLLFLYSEGNPRRFISTIKESGFLALKEGREEIEEGDVKNAVKPYLVTYLKGLSLSYRDRDLLSTLEESSVSENIKRWGYSKQLFYKYLSRLEEKGLVEVVGGKIFLSNKARIMRKIGML